MKAYVSNTGLIEEWDFSRNKENPDNITCGSGRKVWWVCSKGHEWESFVYNRHSGYNCRFCSLGCISGVSQRWLDSLNVPVESREVKLKDIGFRVDGFESETDTVYEFLGDYWHGNPAKFSPDKINVHNKKSFGKLFDETIVRLNKIRAAGYKLEVIWEADFNKL